jgi:sec-independent protein translocase protein TatC
MERMSLLDHLDELRSRILRALAGIGVAFLICVIFTDELWSIVSQPSTAAMASLGLHEKLAFTTPMEAFSTIWASSRY